MALEPDEPPLEPVLIVATRLPLEYAEIVPGVTMVKVDVELGPGMQADTVRQLLPASVTAPRISTAGVLLRTKVSPAEPFKLVGENEVPFHVTVPSAAADAGVAAAITLPSASKAQTPIVSSRRIVPP